MGILVTSEDYCKVNCIVKSILSMTTLTILPKFIFGHVTCLLRHFQWCISSFIVKVKFLLLACKILQDLAYGTVLLCPDRLASLQFIGHSKHPFYRLFLCMEFSLTHGASLFRCFKCHGLSKPTTTTDSWFKSAPWTPHSQSQPTALWSIIFPKHFPLLTYSLLPSAYVSCLDICSITLAPK